MSSEELLAHIIEVRLRRRSRPKKDSKIGQALKKKQKEALANVSIAELEQLLSLSKGADNEVK